MARQGQCTARTVRFYEQRGLLSVDARTSGRHRRYSAEDLERLRLIVELRHAGFSLEEIRAFFDMQRCHVSGAAASNALRGLLRAKIAENAAEVAELLRSQNELERLHRGLLICQDCDSGPAFPGACAKCERLAGAGDHPLLWALRSQSP
jgi:DNA-binding transcriptional MerR regulator